MTFRWNVAIGCVLISLAATGPALAYVDPGSSGLIFQIISPLIVLWLAGSSKIRRAISDFFKALIPESWRRRK